MTEKKGMSLIQSLNTLKKHKERRILCVDDEEFCIASISALLFKIGIDVNNQVDFCINGQEALECANLS